jgi:hypothetical protein
MEKQHARDGQECGASLSKPAGKWNFAWLVIFYKPSCREREGEIRLTYGQKAVV